LGAVGLGPTPQPPIPNPQSPIPIENKSFKNLNNSNKILLFINF